MPSVKPALFLSFAFSVPTMSNDQFSVPSLFGKIVDCSGIFCPTFQPKRFISASPTSTPVRVRAQASRSDWATSISGYRSR